MRIKTNITSLGIKAKRLFTELVQSSDWTIHPNGYSGRGRYASRTADHATTLADSLEELGLVRGRHFTTGNDAPRGGWSGEFVTLLPAGRRLKVVTDNKTPAPPAPAPSGVTDGKTLTISPLDSDDWRELIEWYGAGAVHPCPDTILAIKLKSRLSWRQIEDKCEELRAVELLDSFSQKFNEYVTAISSGSRIHPGEFSPWDSSIVKSILESSSD
jgi:hypothetical protein